MFLAASGQGIKPQPYEKTNDFRTGDEAVLPKQADQRGVLSYKAPTQETYYQKKEAISNRPADLQVAERKAEDGGQVDYARLAKAIGWAETSNCTTGTARYFNCTGIRRGGRFVHYKSKEDSYRDTAEIWRNYYKRFPDIKLADKWTNKDRSATWLKTVKQHYND